jgi:hypothetical protein
VSVSNLELFKSIYWGSLVMPPLPDLASSPRSMFAAIDINGDGYLSVEEVKIAFSGFGQSLVQMAVDQMLVLKHDPPASELGKINIEQFERGLLPVLQSFYKAQEERKVKLRRGRTCSLTTIDAIQQKGEPNPTARPKSTHLSISVQAETPAMVETFEGIQGQATGPTSCLEHPSRERNSLSCQDPSEPHFSVSRARGSMLDEELKEGWDDGKIRGSERQVDDAVDIKGGRGKETSACLDTGAQRGESQDFKDEPRGEEEKDWNQEREELRKQERARAQERERGREMQRRLVTERGGNESEDERCEEDNDNKGAEEDYVSQHNIFCLDSAESSGTGYDDDDFEDVFEDDDSFLTGSSSEWYDGLAFDNDTHEQSPCGQQDLIVRQKALALAAEDAARGSRVDSRNSGGASSLSASRRGSSRGASEVMTRSMTRAKTAEGGSRGIGGGAGGSVKEPRADVGKDKWWAEGTEWGQQLVREREQSWQRAMLREQRQVQRFNVAQRLRGRIKRMGGGGHREAGTVTGAQEGQDKADVEVGLRRMGQACDVCAHARGGVYETVTGRDRMERWRARSGDAEDKRACCVTCQVARETTSGPVGDRIDALGQGAGATRAEAAMAARKFAWERALQTYRNCRSALVSLAGLGVRV